MEDEVKPGYKTTEFYLVLAGELVAVLLASGVVESPEAVKIVALAGALTGRVLYVLGRFEAKKA
jgi:hypothetical protein